MRTNTGVDCNEEKLRGSSQSMKGIPPLCKEKLLSMSWQLKTDR